MDSKGFALIEMLVFAGVALGLGLWQYVSVSRELKKTREEADRKTEKERPES